MAPPEFFFFVLHAKRRRQQQPPTELTLQRVSFFFCTRSEGVKQQPPTELHYRGLQRIRKNSCHTLCSCEANITNPNPKPIRATLTLTLSHNQTKSRASGTTGKLHVLTLPTACFGQHRSLAVVARWYILHMYTYSMSVIHVPGTGR